MAAAVVALIGPTPPAAAPTSEPSFAATKPYAAVELLRVPVRVPEGGSLGDGVTRPRAFTAHARALRTRPRVSRDAAAWRWTQASWYDVRPEACWDGDKMTPVRHDIRIWTAHKTLPCGTLLAVAGPVGTLLVRVRDRGPYVDGRDLDLSRAAFEHVCGAPSRGLCQAAYRVVA